MVKYREGAGAINNIYNSNDNFFIKKPGKELTNTNIKDPFSVMNTFEEQKIYLLYDSWTDERTIPILQLELGLTVIIIDKYENNYRLALANHERSEKRILKSLTWFRYFVFSRACV